MQEKPNSCLNGAFDLQRWLTELKERPNIARIYGLKCLLLMALLAGTVSLVYLTHERMTILEHSKFLTEFKAVSDIMFGDLKYIFHAADLAMSNVAVIYADVRPDADQWPNGAWSGFLASSTLLAKATSLESIMMLPIVTPEKAESYKQHIYEFYNADESRLKDIYFNPLFSNGDIWRTNYSTFPPKSFVDSSGNSTGSAHRLSTPIAQYVIGNYLRAHMANIDLHADPAYTATIDTVIDCVEENKQNYTKATSSCGVMSLSFPNYSNELDPEITDMMAVFAHPIIPVNNKDTLVGFAAGIMGWRGLLTMVVPAEYSGVDIVVGSPDDEFTYRVTEGKVKFMGTGDHHDRDYDGYRRTSVALQQDLSALGLVQYTISLYPTGEFEGAFTTSQPFRSALVVFGTFLFCAILFALYDRLTQREFDRNQAVLDTKRRFVRFISHEIRTPLNTVCLGMKLLGFEMTKFASSLSGQSGKLMDQMNKALQGWKALAEEIVESSETAVEVLNDLLNYDKIELGTLKLEFSYVEPSCTVKRTVAMMQVQAQQKNISLSVTDERSRRCSSAAGTALSPRPFSFTGPTVVVGDSYRLGQVLRNLVSNALKFTPAEGQVYVTVTEGTAKLPLPEGLQRGSALFEGMVQAGSVRIAVKDTGAGLTPKQLEEICAEGVQFNANELQAGQGSGLGLFISKGIVEQHGGRLSVASEGLGKGVTFTVELPLFRAKSAERRRSLDDTLSTSGCVTPTMPNSANLRKEGSDAPLPAKRVLVVDDSSINRKMVLRLLRAQEFVCEEAEDGQKALEKYEEMVARGEPPDAILMDFEMPVMNGPTATARLREMGCACLIVGVTGNVLPADKEAFRSAGADRVLPKPLAMSDLLQIFAEGRITTATRGVPSLPTGAEKHRSKSLLVTMGSALFGTSGRRNKVYAQVGEEAV